MTWTVRQRHIGTVHIVRYWEVCLNGVAVDTFDNREMAEALTAFRNAREVGAGKEQKCPNT